MKKLVKIGLFLVLLLALGACDKSSDNVFYRGDGVTENQLEVMKEILEDEGYVFEERDQTAIDYYNENSVNTKYSIDVQVEILYIAYINSSERWLELIDFETSADAIIFFEAIQTQDDTDLLVYIRNKSVIITYSQDTIDAFY
jgi:hypothetical protein